MPCKYMDDCQGYEVMLSSLDVWKTLYCLNDSKYPDCARFKLSATGAAVPVNLLPNGKYLLHKSEPKKEN